MGRRAVKTPVHQLRDYTRGSTVTKGQTESDSPASLQFHVKAWAGPSGQPIDLGSMGTFNEAKKLAQEELAKPEFEVTWIEDADGNKYSNTGDRLPKRGYPTEPFPNKKSKAKRKHPRGPYKGVLQGEDEMSRGDTETLHRQETLPRQGGRKAGPVELLRQKERMFQKWLLQYTNGTGEDFDRLPQPKQDEIFARFEEDMEGPWGQPDELIDLKGGRQASRRATTKTPLFREFQTLIMGSEQQNMQGLIQSFNQKLRSKSEEQRGSEPLKEAIAADVLRKLALDVHKTAHKPSVQDSKAAANMVGKQWGIPGDMLYKLTYHEAATMLPEADLKPVKSNKAAELLELFNKISGGLPFEELQGQLIKALERSKINPEDKQKMERALSTQKTPLGIEKTLHNFSLKRQGLGTGLQVARKIGRVVVSFVIPWTERDLIQQAQRAAKVLPIELKASTKVGVTVTADHHSLADAHLVMAKMNSTARRAARDARSTGAILHTQMYTHLDGSSTGELHTRLTPRAAAKMASDLIDRGMTAVTVVDGYGAAHVATKATSQSRVASLLSEDEVKEAHRNYETYHQADEHSDWRPVGYHNDADEATRTAKARVRKKGGTVKIMAAGEHPDDHDAVATFQFDRRADRFLTKQGADYAEVWAWDTPSHRWVMESMAVPVGKARQIAVNVAKHKAQNAVIVKEGQDPNQNPDEYITLIKANSYGHDVERNPHTKPAPKKKRPPGWSPAWPFQAPEVLQPRKTASRTGSRRVQKEEIRLVRRSRRRADLSLRIP